MCILGAKGLTQALETHVCRDSLLNHIYLEAIYYMKMKLCQF